MTRRKRRFCEDRDDLASWAVNVWRDAVAFKQTHEQVMANLAKMRESTKWKRIPQYQREYVNGYERCFYNQVIRRHYLECGDWVRMPDGMEKWFGVVERTEAKEEIGGVGPHRYIHENKIPGKDGIYWIADTKSLAPSLRCEPGEKIFFVVKE